LRTLLVSACACALAPAAAQAAAQIDSGPSGVVTSNSATFTFSDSSGGILFAGFSCQLDANPAGPCGGSVGNPSGSATYTSLADGPHTFSVSSTGLTADSTPAVRNWTVDTIDPDTAISGPTGAINTTTPQYSFGAADANPLGFECSTDNVTYTACTSPHTYSLPQGPSTVYVRAVDAAGHVDPSPASASVTVDTVAPTLRITDGPPAFTNQPSTTLTYSVDDSVSLACLLDGSATPCSGTSKTVGPLPDGDHNFSVTGTDAAGNVSAAVTRSWTVDTVAPDTTITAAPSGTVETASAHFEFGASEPASFACQIDSGAPAACSSPLDLSGLANGDHTVSITAVDRAGNLDGSPDTRTWTVAVPPDSDGDGVPDRSDTCASAAGPAPSGCPAPKASFLRVTKKAVQRAGVRFDGSASSAAPGLELGRYRWDYGDGFSETTTIPETIHAYRKAGRFTAKLVVTDALGVSSPAATVAVIVDDGDPPAVSIASPKQGGRVRASRALTLRGAASDASGIKSVRVGLRPLRFTGRRLRGCRWYVRGRLRSARCTSVRTFAAKVKGRKWSIRIPAKRLPRGVYELRVVAIDRAGLPSPTLSVESRTILTFTVF
jgi:hypothetical protein